MEQHRTQAERSLFASAEQYAAVFVSYRTIVVAGERRAQSLRSAATVPIFARDRPRSST